ncbi:AtpZ/AtpI family protein [Chloroflexota bacterium]
MSRWEAALRLTGVGFFIGTCIVLGVVGGLWIDDKLGTKPVFILAGLVLGFVIAGYGVYRMLIPLLAGKQDDKEKN